MLRPGESRLTNKYDYVVIISLLPRYSMKLFDCLVLLPWIELEMRPSWTSLRERSRGIYIYIYASGFAGEKGKEKQENVSRLQH